MDLIRLIFESGRQFRDRTRSGIFPENGHTPQCIKSGQKVKFLQNMIERFYQYRSLPDQSIASAGCTGIHIARNGEDTSALFDCLGCRDEGTAVQARFHHHGPLR